MDEKHCDMLGMAPAKVFYMLTFSFGLYFPFLLSGFSMSVVVAMNRRAFTRDPASLAGDNTLYKSR